MSKERPQRKVNRIDYKISNRTGKKVLKENKKLEEVSEKLDKIMSREQLVSDEAKLCLKIERFVKDNEIELFFDVTEIDEERYFELTVQDTDLSSNNSDRHFSIRLKNETFTSFALHH